MRSFILVLFSVFALCGCKTANYPRIVNDTESDLRITIEFEDGRLDEWTIKAGDDAWLGRKEVGVATISLMQQAEMRTLTKEDFRKFGFARVYAVRSIHDIQKIE